MIYEGDCLIDAQCYVDMVALHIDPVETNMNKQFYLACMYTWILLDL